MKLLRDFLFASVVVLGLTVLISGQTTRVTNSSTSLSGKTLVTAEDARTITGLFTYSRGASAPFAVNSGSATVTNLSADLLDGLSSASFLGAPSVITLTSTGPLNDLTLTGATSGNDVVALFNNASLATITGIAAPARSGTHLFLYAIGAGNITFAHQNVGSTTSNRLVNHLTSAATTLAAGFGNAHFIYDGVAQRWRLLELTQGAPLTWTPTITGSGGSSGQVYSAQQGSYYVNGAQVTFWGRVTLSTKGTITSNAQIASLPYTAATSTNFPMMSIPFFGAFSTSVSSVGGWVQASTSVANLTYVPAAGGTSQTNIVTADLTNTSDLMFSGSYIGQ